MGFNLSPNMNLPIPQVGNEPGPEYAQDVNNCLTLVDQHNHSPGQGEPVNPSGLDINADLDMQDNNLINAKSIRFFSQPSPLSGISDLDCLYVSGDDLYYNDGLGNQIRITIGGSVDTPSQITGLVPPASVSYNDITNTFVFQSDINTPAYLDSASIILRNLVANSFGLTLSPPTLTSDYEIILPPLPAQQNIVTLDEFGVMAADWNVDDVSIEIVGNNITSKHSYITYEFKVNGPYSILTAPITQLDGLCFFNFNAEIINVWAYITDPGGSGTTTIDLQVTPTPGGSFTTIFSTKPAFASTAATSSYVDAMGVIAPGTGVTAPVLSTVNITAGSAMRFNLDAVMGSGANDVGIVVQFKQRN